MDKDVQGRAGMVIWVCGLSGSGKTTLCKTIWSNVKPNLPELVLLDGDLIRAAFGQDLGYREEDRITQIKRLQNIAKMLSDQKLVVMVAALYANPELLEWNRKHISDYFEIYLEASLDTVRGRDTNRLYARAATGDISHVVGMDIPWHAPETPDLVLNTDGTVGVDVLAQRVIEVVPRLARAMETTL